jgi:hypothetical protein
MSGEDVGIEGVERKVRIFEGPERIAGVETDADVIFTGELDQ